MQQATSSRRNSVSARPGQPVSTYRRRYTRSGEPQHWRPDRLKKAEISRGCSQSRLCPHGPGYEQTVPVPILGTVPIREVFGVTPNGPQIVSVASQTLKRALHLLKSILGSTC
ncbi:hypothetical protein RRG08_024637 [Elysia crispata]|uniref:Uncharacterized protein n=1 Tax=Elysia crispata TaxID=231223 RepID=A0AAE1DPF1_9GAST|nr:hypothetical protein RRG08_024637 [Elysia crispata]